VARSSRDTVAASSPVSMPRPRREAAPLPGSGNDERGQAMTCAGIPHCAPTRGDAHPPAGGCCAIWCWRGRREPPRQGQARYPGTASRAGGRGGTRRYRAARRFIYGDPRAAACSCRAGVPGCRATHRRKGRRTIGGAGPGWAERTRSPRQSRVPVPPRRTTPSVIVPPTRSSSPVDRYSRSPALSAGLDRSTALPGRRGLTRDVSEEGRGGRALKCARHRACRASVRRCRCRPGGNAALHPAVPA